ncbi:DENN domain-containing protein 5A [Orchesella cincta]|uniref:DENN domain-containing protein 5A n=1 Tax=Orchesella cincta TaxID=48709 RepID=A0A1D2MA36_ORCCI|nr:DENN domain-containing protein 5A [Orchesella cincta]
MFKVFGMEHNTSQPKKITRVPFQVTINWHLTNNNQSSPKVFMTLQRIRCINRTNIPLPCCSSCSAIPHWNFKLTNNQPLLKTCDLRIYLRRRLDEDISLESNVYHLLYYVPLPPPSRSVKLTYFGDSITCPRPKPSELPLFDYFMSDLFRLLDLDSPVPVDGGSGVCNNIPFSIRVCMCMFPFTLHYFLDAPVPFIMELHAVTDGKDNIPCEANLCFVDIDNNVLQVPEDLPTKI